jgi:hypothetical protein
MVGQCLTSCFIGGFRITATDSFATPKSGLFALLWVRSGVVSDARSTDSSGSVNAAVEICPGPFCQMGGILRYKKSESFATKPLAVCNYPKENPRKVRFPDEYIVSEYLARR